MIQSKILEQAKKIMGDTIENIAIEIDQKDINLEFIEIKIGLPGSKVIEKMNILGFKKIPSTRKGDGNMDRLNNSLNNHNNNNNRKQ